MPSPQQEIDDLDRELADVGEQIVLRRVDGVKMPDRQPYDVAVQAKVRAVGAPNPLVTGITQADLYIIMSPTEIIAGAWPGLGVEGDEPFWTDRSLPIAGDTLIVKGKKYKARIVEPVAIQDVVVRINITTTGGASA